MKTVLKWMWRVIRFPFVLATWVVSCLFVGVVAPFDWLINPSKWNGFERKDFNRKDRKNGY